MFGLLVSGCGQSIKDIPVPVEFQRPIRDVAGGAQPGFTGSTCFSKPLEERDSHRYRAEYTVPGPVAKVAEQLRAAGVTRGWQPYRTKTGEFLLVRGHNRDEVIVGVAADGQNTKVSAVSEDNCNDAVPRDPLSNAMQNADPDLAPRQRQLLASAYDAVRELGVGIGPMLDPGKADPDRLPSPPPIPDDYPSTDLAGCDVNPAEGTRGAQWRGSGPGAPLAGFVTDTTDLKVVEDRIQTVAGKRWKATSRKQDGSQRLSYTLERDIGGVSAALTVELAQAEDHRKKPGVQVKGNLLTGCVPPSVG
nr:hypothetical protein [Kibdelosporangium sp. MJ126-NF4]